MKLCKDCKHIEGEVIPHCGHPDAPHSVIDGRPSMSCVLVRGAGPFGVTDCAVCWPDAKLFEERPPIAEDKPEVQSPVVAMHDQLPISSFVGRVFERLFRGAR